MLAGSTSGLLPESITESDFVGAFQECLGSCHFQRRNLCEDIKCVENMAVLRVLGGGVEDGLGTE